MRAGTAKLILAALAATLVAPPQAGAGAQCAGGSASWSWREPAARNETVVSSGAGEFCSQPIVKTTLGTCRKSGSIWTSSVKKVLTWRDSFTSASSAVDGAPTAKFSAADGANKLVMAFPVQAPTKSLCKKFRAATEDLLEASVQALIKLGFPPVRAHRTVVRLRPGGDPAAVGTSAGAGEEICVPGTIIWSSLLGTSLLFASEADAAYACSDPSTSLPGSFLGEGRTD
ncbi:MAG TPA: hypothetical protein VGB83_06015 [Actinomycetota bacterium]